MRRAAFGEPGDLLAQGLHPSHHAVPRPLRLLHLRQGAGPVGVAVPGHRGRARHRPGRPRRRDATRHSSPWAKDPRIATRLLVAGSPSTGTARPSTTWSTPAGRSWRRRGSSPTPMPAPWRPTSCARLRPVTASQGMMIESLNPGLPAHRNAPDKTPARRLATLEAAGTTRRPIHHRAAGGHRRVTGTIGWSPSVAIAESHRRHGHVQEVIVQNFLPKPGTAMHRAPACPPSELAWTIAAARLVLPPRRARAGAAQPLGRLGRVARRRHRRLGRRVAGHRRPREPRASLAGSRRPAGRHRGKRRRCSLLGSRSTPSSPSIPSAGWTTPCAFPCSTLPMPRAWPVTMTGRRAGSGRTPRAGPGGEGAGGIERVERVEQVEHTPRADRLVRGGGPVDEVLGGRARRPGGRRGRDRHVVRRPWPRGATGGRRRRPLAVRSRGRRGDLRRQPQHQLHQRLHLQVPLLRLLEGTTVPQPAGASRTSSASTRSAPGWSKPKPGAPPRCACKAASIRTSTATTTWR